MHLDGLLVLQVVDHGTLFSAAIFFCDGESTKVVWRAYVQCWETPYVGYSESMHRDKGSQLTSGQWRALMIAYSINHLESGVKSHNSLGVSER